MDGLDCLDTLQYLQAVHLKLCLPYLDAEDVRMLRCTCCELRDMDVSWKDHSIIFELEMWPRESAASALSWLNKNIGSMQQLRIIFSYKMPEQQLQDLVGAGR
jgi:hypothetical protein